MYTDEEIEKMIIDDYKFICEWQGVEVDDKEIERLLKLNFENFKKHLHEHGNIANFRYK